MDVEQTTESEDRKEKDAADAAERIKRGQHWLDWMYVAGGLEVGRQKAMRRAGTNRPIGSAYNKAFGEWLDLRPWARDLDKPTRTHLFWCVDHRNELERWRETLAQNERARLNHPTAMKRRYEATHRDTAVVKAKTEAATPEAFARAEEIGKLKDEIAMRDREIDFLKAAPKKDDGSLFDLNRDTAADIAKTIRGHVGLARTRGIRDALTKLVKEEEAALRKTPKQAG
jgi:hypothetical protein